MAQVCSFSADHSYCKTPPPLRANTIKLSLPPWGRCPPSKLGAKRDGEGISCGIALSPAFGGSSPRGRAFFVFLNLMVLLTKADPVPSYQKGELYSPPKLKMGLIRPDCERNTKGPSVA